MAPLGLLALGHQAQAQYAQPPGPDQETAAPLGADVAPLPQLTTAPPGVLPATGFATGDTGGGSTLQPSRLDRQITQVFAPAGGGVPTGPAWQFTPSIGLTEELTDNAATSAGGGKRGDLITTIQPALLATGDTQRLQVNLAYSPQIYLYARDGNQDRVGQDFNGRALATLVPQTLFLDVRATGTEQALSGGLGPNSAGTLSNNQTSQAYSFSASPYLVHRFGGTGTGEIGYTIERTTQTGTGAGTAPPGFALFPAAVLPANQRTTTQNVHAAFVTGEDFGRYNGTVLATATHFDGTGVLANAHRDIFSIDNGYAITRTVTVLASVGYENIRYSGTAPLRISDALWDVGLRLTPNAGSTLTVRYGHHDGLDSLTVDGALSPTPRTRLYVRYSEGLSTNLEELQNALATTDLDALGNPVDATTGAPIFEASNFFGVQDTLSRLRRFSLTGAYLLGRNTLTASVEHDSYSVISAPVSTPGTLGSNSGTYGTLTWTHELTPRLTSTAQFEYGVRTADGPSATTQDVLVATAGLTYVLGPKLSGALQYSHEETTGGSAAGFGGAGNLSDNILLLSIVKTF